MVKPQKNTATKTKTKTKLKVPTKKQGPTKRQPAQGSRKRKPEDTPTDSEESLSSDTEPTCLPHRKRAKESAANIEEVIEDEPEDVTVSDSADATSSNEKVRGWAQIYDKY